VMNDDEGRLAIHLIVSGPPGRPMDVPVDVAIAAGVAVSIARSECAR
jgi:hypothetical protein